MKVSGFTFIKDALIYDYPIVEAIQSILPICDEVVVAVGASSDDTLDLIRDIDKSKIKIVETNWDEDLRKGGRILSVETNKALRQIAGDADWAFYIQGDEVVHEQYLQTIYDAMSKCLDEPGVDGLLFHYLHFYGSYDYVGASSKWYPHEIRVIRNDKSIYSYKDAQGFRKGQNEKLRVRPIEAYIYHYGWVKEPHAMQRKQENFNKYWHDDNWIEANVAKASAFDYARHLTELKPFGGDHPKVMQRRIAAKNWQFDCDISFSRKTLKDKVKGFLKSRLGVDVGYRNYVVVGRSGQGGGRGAPGHTV